jgi:hypothetical protein
LKKISMGSRELFATGHCKTSCAPAGRWSDVSSGLLVKHEESFDERQL